MSRLALGPDAFGASGGASDEQSAAELLRRYLDDGGNFLDVGDPSGRAEELCGRLLRGSRAEVVLATRVGTTSGGDPVGGATSRRNLRAACEASLRRLRTDHLDLFQVDVDDPVTPLGETVEALDDLVRAGKVLYVGAANYLPYRLM
nr:aldo/keto reductase [Micromonospora sp. DSM 115978]